MSDAESPAQASADKAKGIDREPIRQHSAGGVLVRADRVLLISTRDGTRWQLPKGRIEGSETAAQAAQREVEEETGVLGHVLDPLDTIDFIYERRSGRTVHKRIDLFLLGYRSGSAEDFDPNEVTEARWFTWSEALETLTFDNERSVVALAQDAWHRALIEDPAGSNNRTTPGLRPLDQTASDATATLGAGPRNTTKGTNER